VYVVVITTPSALKLAIFIRCHCWDIWH